MENLLNRTITIAFYKFDETNEDEMYLGEFKGYLDFTQNLEIDIIETPVKFCISYMSLWIKEISIFAKENNYIIIPTN